MGVAGVDDVGGIPGLVPSVRLPEDTLASPADALVKLDNVISSSTGRFFTVTGRIPTRAQEASGVPEDDAREETTTPPLTAADNTTEPELPQAGSSCASSSPLSALQTSGPPAHESAVATSGRGDASPPNPLLPVDYLPMSPCCHNGHKLHRRKRLHAYFPTPPPAGTGGTGAAAADRCH